MQLFFLMVTCKTAVRPTTQGCLFRNEGVILKDRFNLLLDCLLAIGLEQKSRLVFNKFVTYLCSFYNISATYMCQYKLATILNAMLEFQLNIVKVAFFHGEGIIL